MCFTMDGYLGCLRRGGLIFFFFFFFFFCDLIPYDDYEFPHNVLKRMAHINGGPAALGWAWLGCTIGAVGEGNA